MTRWLAGLCSAAVILGAARADPPALPADAGRLEPVKEISIDAHGREPVCRRYTPTGSRIAKRRCDAPPTSEAEREQLRRDIEEMRMRQLMREQARAFAEKARRRP